ncbi:MAG: SapC family protein [Methylococcales bacterium]|jgi:hypothetical protein|nr:SapC family protein [Methylococcales bacterium]MBT7445421.1 SapC family protein [Methylococcales bacterium]
MSDQTPLPLFYKNVAALKQDTHHAWRVPEPLNFSFASQTNLVYLTQLEFSLAARHYPIVFSESADTLVSVALVGLEKDRNLFVSGEGEWLAETYIPAYVRRYPFILATADDGKTFTVCLDEDYRSLEKDKTVGKLMFTKQGEQSASLKQHINFLKEYEAQVEATKQFCYALKGLDLFEPVQAQISPKGMQEFSLSGFMVVNRKKLNQLNGDQLAALAKKGYLEVIYQHLWSLDTFQHLLNLHVQNNQH